MGDLRAQLILKRELGNYDSETDDLPEVSKLNAQRIAMAKRQGIDIDHTAPCVQR